MRRFLFFSSLSLPLFLSSQFTIASSAAGDSQNVQFSEKVEIPGATLKPGTYSLSVEDRLSDRAIVRITSTDSDKHYLVLSVPADNIVAYGPDNLALFTGSSGKGEALKAWKCPGCAAGLEFVYPKAGAAKLTSDTASSVLAFDPQYDKLPAKLTSDDMKVVTLWLLSPKRIEGAKNGKDGGTHGKGVTAAKYAAPTAAGTQMASTQHSSAPATTASAPAAQAVAAPAPAAPLVAPRSAAMTASEPTTTASISTPTASAPIASTATASGQLAAANSPEPTVAIASDAPGHLPKTASNTYGYGLAGVLSLCLAFGLRVSRTRRLFS